jgi:hypothetical protein
MTAEKKSGTSDAGPTWEIMLTDDQRAIVAVISRWLPLDADGLREFAEGLLGAATEIDGRETEISIVVVNGVDA